MANDRRQPAPEPAPPDDSYQALAIEVTRRAIAAHRDGQALYEEASRRAHERADDPSLDARANFVEARHWQVWSDLALKVSLEAEKQVIRCVIAMGDRDHDRLGGFNDAELVAFPPRALAIDGRLYVAFHDENDDTPPGQRSKDGKSIMFLVNLPLSDVARPAG